MIRDNENNDSNDQDLIEQPLKRQKLPSSSATLYLDTVNRSRLDFDFEKVCSVTLSNTNIYACLVCGKYFQGRGTTSQSQYHSLEQDHHVFINMNSLKVFVLPDEYEVNDSTLNDIKYVIQPTYSPSEVLNIDTEKVGHDLSFKPFIPGYVGLNNIKQNDYVNVILQSLCHIKPLRNYFLSNNFSDQPLYSELAKKFGLLVRKIWNAKAFKSHVSPHELLQEIYSLSKKRFKITHQSDPIEFLPWFLNNIHLGLQGTKKKNSSIIYQLFQGDLTVESQQFVLQPTIENGKKVFDATTDIQLQKSPFLFLTLDLPMTPLFKDVLERNIIPQIGIEELLKKYDGIRGLEFANLLKKYRLDNTPPYLIIYIKRFSPHGTGIEKNNTLVTFPLNNLAIGNDEYALVVNIVHSGSYADGRYHCYVCNSTRKTWYLMEDLIVEEVSAQTVFLSQAYIQIWEKQSKSSQ